MKFLKTMMAAALLTTAIAGNVMAADQFGIEGAKEKRKFVLSQNLAQAIKDGTLTGKNEAENKKISFAGSVFNAIISKTKVTDDDVIAALGKVADNKVEHLVGAQLNLAADWTDPTAKGIIENLVNETAQDLVNQLGLKSPLEVAFEIAKSNSKFGNIVATVDGNPVKISDITLEEATKATIGKKNTPFIDYFSRDAKYLSKVSKLDKAKEDINVLQTQLSSMVPAKDKQAVDNQLVAIQEELRLANEELKKPKLTPQQEQILNGLAGLEQLVDEELTVSGTDILSKLTELVQQAAQASIYKSALDKLKSASTSNSTPPSNPLKSPVPTSTHKTTPGTSLLNPSSQSQAEGFPDLSGGNSLNSGNSQQQVNPLPSKKTYTPEQEAQIEEYIRDYGGNRETAIRDLGL